MSEANPEYQPVTVYDGEGEFLGYAVHHVGTTRLRITHLYTDAEVEDLKRDMERLNVGADMTAHWPANDDPEFIALIADPEFEPIEYTMEDVIDDEALEAMVQRGEIEPVLDETSGNTYWPEPEKVPMKRAKVPLDPSAPQARMRRAAETIALRRMKADNDASD